MIKKLLFHLIILLALNLSFGQNTMGTILITEDAYEGYTLFSTHTKAYLIDNCGREINSWSSSYVPGNAVYLMPNGNLLRAGRLVQSPDPVALGGAGGVIEMFDWDGNVIWTWTDSSDTSRAHHDVFPLPNGNVLILAATVVDGADAIQAGRDPNLLTDNQLYNERIYEVEPIGATGGNIVWEWNVMDHVIQNIDASKDNFGIVEDNPGKIDINFLNGFDPINNWLHFNAIQYYEEFDQIVISSRRMSEVWVIDHNTTTSEAAGPAGDILYRWGNPQAYGQGTEMDRKLYGQHTPYYIPTGLPNEGKLMIFNNGFQRTPEYSQVDIIEPPVDINGNYTYVANTAYGPTDTFYTFPSTPPTEPSDFYSAIVSSARQLPNGNILICEGREAHFFEIDSNENVVWEYISPISNADGTVYEQGEPSPPNNFSFRATKFSPDYPAFIGRDLTPGDPLEANPDLTPCNNLSVSEFENSIVSLYPNPTKNRIQINSTTVIDRVEIYNMMGSKIGETSSKTIDLSNNSDGVYFLKIYSDTNMVSKKVIKG
ncbi:aryl-sulfate sulfotransferase [Winogradskyella ouciana]|uniref:T9SS type A sorting domain-containing protein n=1 Tax=Winogradskyella ouciana TaxID=2608631 RepID=A0A7K1GFV9_9FLAO|nr:aryl-sulfate sulfotransferase [Winogradskyella ouciana]MTE27961.1 T9SS type A sorting domain-containing protein [Winogradskyella ouciana]